MLRAPAAALALLALLAIEPGRSPHTPHDNDSAAKPLPIVGGLRVAIDTDTGEKVQAPPLRLETLSPELRAALQRSADGLILVRQADGSKHVNLEGRFMSGIAVHVVGTGSVTSYCTTAPQHSVLPQPQTPPSARPELR